MDKKTKTVKNTDKTVTVIATGDSLFTADCLGVNYLRHETAYKVDGKDIETLKKIAEKTNINFTRNLSVATGFILPDEDGTFIFGGKLFTTDWNAPSTVCNKKDLARITETVKAALMNIY